jgi:signal transduction histidine kinase
VATSMEGNPGTIRIDVSDTGKGIDKAILDRIFEPFFTTKSKGTGLGLSICRQLIEQHGGTITAEENPGGGTRFLVRRPVRSVAPAGTT